MNKNVTIEDLINKIKLNYKDYINKENFIGIGSCRVAYKLNESLVLKIHLNSLGFKQSKMEYEIYHNLKFKNYQDMLTNQIYYCDSFSICEYISPIEKYSDGCEVWCCEEIPFNYDESRLDNLFELMSNIGISVDDLSNTNNIGISKNNNIVFLDYGFKDNNYDELDLIMSLNQEKLFQEIKDTKDYSRIETYIESSIYSVN